MFPFRFYAATGDAVAQLDSLNGESVDVSLNLEGRGVMCRAYPRAPTSLSLLPSYSLPHLHHRCDNRVRSTTRPHVWSGSCPISPPAPSPSSSPTSKAVPRSGSGIGRPCVRPSSGSCHPAEPHHRPPRRRSSRSSVMPCRPLSPPLRCGSRRARCPASAGAEAWPESVGPLRVRMALHTAAATPQDGDYLAPGLNRLSRLLAAAHGGQVLLSLATQDLPGTRCRQEQACVISVSIRYGTSIDPSASSSSSTPIYHPTFPPIRTLATRPNNLPLQPTPFLGREDQVAQVVIYSAVMTSGCSPSPTRRRRQDAPGAPSCRRSVGGLSRWRLVR